MQYFSNNNFIPESYYVLTYEPTTIVVYQYRFKNNPYLIIADKDKLDKTPYTQDYIEQLHSSKDISCSNKSKDAIISAYLIDSDKNTKDYIKEVQQLCGPLGDFYKDTTNELYTKNLQLYIDHKFPYNDYCNLIIMLSDGSEIDLLCDK
tara:strand:+ start:3810 stop:4256 length:447 start_codon:yes stop_codon:yes gene_type:complete